MSEKKFICRQGGGGEKRFRFSFHNVSSRGSVTRVIKKLIHKKSPVKVITACGGPAWFQAATIWYYPQKRFKAAITRNGAMI